MATMNTAKLQNLCTVWTEYMQCSLGDTNVRYFIREDGVLMFESEDEDFFESSERLLVQDINDAFEEWFRDKSLDWLKCEYVEEVLGLEYENNNHVYNEVCELLTNLGYDKCNSFILYKLKQRFDSPEDRAWYMLNTLR